MGMEEDTYSSIFQALKHPIRRRILRMLNDNPMTYTEVLNELGIDNGLLNYHLENLQELLAKGEDEKYRLSEFGKAGLSVIEKVEIPKESHTKLNLFKPDNLPTLLIILLLFVSALTNGYYYVLNMNLKNENLQLKHGKEETISGIVINRNGNRIWIRLGSPDQVNNKEVGEIMEYYISNKDIDIEAGDYLQGKLSENCTITNLLITPFFQYDYHEGFTICGDLLLFSGGKITNDLTDPYPSLKFNIKNLGSKEIIAVRATVNDVILPYTFGVSQDSPLRPSREESFSRYTAWYVPGGGTGGFLPLDGEGYNVSVTVRFSDLSTQTFTRSDVFKEGGIGSIRFMISKGYIFFSEPDLLWLGLDEGASLSLSFRNVWYKKPEQETANVTIKVGENYGQTVERLELYLQGSLVWEEDVRIEPSRYFATTIHVPRDLTPGQIYDVTMVAHSQQGLNSTYTVPTLCQYIRIK